MVMTAFNALNGVPCTSSKYLVKEVLREKWGFNGVVTSDYSSVSELHISRNSGRCQRVCGKGIGFDRY